MILAETGGAVEELTGVWQVGFRGGGSGPSSLRTESSSHIASTSGVSVVGSMLKDSNWMPSEE